LSLLFDQNISFRILNFLGDDFPSAQHVKTCDLTNASDRTIFDYAKNEGLAIITFDSDYSDMALVNGFPPKIIWLRIGNQSTSAVASILRQNKVAIHQFLLSKDVGILEITG